jgi:O-antigen/teichoic acid export membrane protein
VSGESARGAGTGGLAVGVLTSTLLAYAYQTVGGRLLGPVDFAPLSVLWTLMFLVATILLVPLEQFVARESTLGHRVLTRRSVPVAAVAAGAMVVAAAFVAVTRTSLFDGDPRYVPLTAGMVGVLTAVLVGRGLFTGHRRFGRYGLSLALEAIGRLVVGLAGWWLVGGAWGLALGLAAGPLLALAVPFLGLERAAPRGRSDAAGRFLGPYIGAGIASQLLLASAPLAVAALGGSATTISVVFVTFTSFRTPVSVIYLVQGRLLSAIVGLRARGEDARLIRLVRTTALTGGVAVVVGAAAGALLGPPLVALLFGAAFRPSTVLAALVAAGVTAAATSQLLSQATVAEGRTDALARRWVAGLATAVAIAVAVPLAPDLRVAIGFAVGEAVTCAAMARGTLRLVRQGATGGNARPVDPGPVGPVV